MRRELGMFVALLLLCAGLWWSNDAFVGQANMISLTLRIAMLGTFAIGTAFVIVTGGIDLSVGSIVGLTGVLLAKFSAPENLDTPAAGGYGWPVWWGVVAALGIVVLIGLIQGLLITTLDLQPFIVTLGGMLLIRGVSQVIVEGGSLSVSDITFGPWRFWRWEVVSQTLFTDLPNKSIFALPDPDRMHGWSYVLRSALGILSGYPMLVMIATAIVCAYILHFTVFGRYIYAIGGNRDAAQYSGIPVKRVETLTYVISAFTAGIAGVCYAAYIGQMSQSVGVAYELQAIAAAVLGGVSLRGGEGTVFGVLVGSSIMKVIENGINMVKVDSTSIKKPFLRKIVKWIFGVPDAHGRVDWRLNDNWQFVIVGAVILIAVILDQLAHIFQAKRRTRQAGAHVASSPPPPSSA
jgi:ribose transport system permease protein